MRVDIVSKEYPPEVYGGAGVHVAELVRALRRLDGVDARVHAFGAARSEPGTESYPDLAELTGANAALRTLGVDLAIADACAGTDLVHSHTWYANMGGHLGGLLAGIPHVLSAHSLEPLRPWKAEQLGGGYRVSSWVERTAYEAAAAIIAVSAAMRDDVLRCYPAVDPARVHVVHNGIDTDDWSLIDDPPASEARRGPRPSLRGVRRSHHAPEGPASLPARRGRTPTRGPTRPVRRRPRHPRDRAGGHRPGREPARIP